MSENTPLPQGWAISNFDDVLEYTQPGPYIVSSTDYAESGPTPVLTPGKSFILGFTSEKQGVFSDIPVIIFDDFTTNIKFVKFKFKVKSSALKILKPRSESVLLKYAFYFMHIVKANTDSHKRYWISDYSKRAIHLPPLLEQERIVAKIEELFSSLEAGVESLKTAKEQLKVYRQAVLMLAFEGRITNMSTPNWQRVRLADIADITGGVTKGKDYKGKHTILLPYLRVANVQDGYLNLDQVKTIEVAEEEAKKYLLQKNDILYTEGGDKDKLGRGCLWNGDIPGCIHQNHIFRARLRDQSIPKFIAYYSQTKIAKDYFFAHAKQTTNLASINMKILSNLLILLPKPEEQQTIVSEIESRFSACDKLEEAIDQGLAQAEALRQSILKKAFEGKLVPQDPKDEPASVLLERIRAEREATIAAATKAKSGKKKAMRGAVPSGARTRPEAKRRPGRPRKSAEIAQEAKRKPGRPRKAAL